MIKFDRFTIWRCIIFVIIFNFAACRNLFRHHYPVYGDDYLRLESDYFDNGKSDREACCDFFFVTYCSLQFLDNDESLTEVKRDGTGPTVGLPELESLFEDLILRKGGQLGHARVKPIRFSLGG